MSTVIAKAHRVCYVFGAGAPPALPPRIAAKALVIAADGGYSYTQSKGIRTDILIGDFDSLAAVPENSSDGPLIYRLPREKDRTDLMAALQYGLGQSAIRFHIYGASGWRLDHTLANIQCLSYLLNHGARGYLYDGETVVTAMNGELRLAPRKRGVVSIFALGESAQGVTVQGLKYDLEGALLAGDFPLGVSNEFTGAPAYIRVEEGGLLLVYPRGTREVEK